MWCTEGSTTDGAEEVVLYVMGYVCAKDLPPIVNNSQYVDVQRSPWKMLTFHIVDSLDISRMPTRQSH